MVLSSEQYDVERLSCTPGSLIVLPSVELMTSGVDTTLEPVISLRLPLRNRTLILRHPLMPR
jgi:hypothetical protein